MTISGSVFQNECLAGLRLLFRGRVFRTDVILSELLAVLDRNASRPDNRLGVMGVADFVWEHVSLGLPVTTISDGYFQ